MTILLLLIFSSLNLSVMAAPNEDKAAEDLILQLQDLFNRSSIQAIVRQDWKYKEINIVSIDKFQGHNTYFLTVESDEVVAHFNIFAKLCDGRDIQFSENIRVRELGKTLLTRVDSQEFVHVCTQYKEASQSTSKENCLHWEFITIRDFYLESDMNRVKNNVIIFHGDPVLSRNFDLLIEDRKNNPATHTLSGKVGPLEENDREVPSFSEYDACELTQKINSKYKLSAPPSE